MQTCQMAAKVSTAKVQTDKNLGQEVTLNPVDLFKMIKITSITI